MIAKRIQRLRTKGWRLPEGAAYVGRGTKWDNPYRLDEFPTGMPMAERRLLAVTWFVGVLFGNIEAPSRALGCTIEDVRRELRGRDLCCGCSLSDLCHADALLEIANRETA